MVELPAFELLRTSRRVLVLLGAGASTSCGLADFRSPDGLYADPLLTATLGDPQALFDARVFREDPELLWAHLHRLLPAAPVAPGPVHAWLAALAAEGRLLRVYTQNVDGLESRAGVPAPLLVEAHGHMRSARCVRCGARVPMGALAGHVAEGRVPFCRRARGGGGGGACGGALRPEVAFFHEELPPAWDAAAARRDAAEADLILVVGTSLRAAPLSHVPSFAPPGVPRVLVNGGDVAPPGGAPFSWSARLLGDAGAILWAAAGGDPTGAARPCGAWRAAPGGALACEAAPARPAAGSGGSAAAAAPPPRFSRTGRPLIRPRA
jgi:NAD-dependent histone deacetylase SIR2